MIVMIESCAILNRFTSEQRQAALCFVLCGEFNVQMQQRNSLSLQRSQMFIAIEHYPNKPLAPLGAKPVSRTITVHEKSDCAPAELRNKERGARL